MNTIEVGGKFPAVQNRGEGVFFEADGGGYTLIYNFKSPTAAELAAVQSEQAFEIRYVSLGGILWVLTKCGSLEWTDAPYTPHLSQHVDDLMKPEAGFGSLLTLLMIDAATNTVKSIRAIGLGEKFSVGMYDEIQKLRNEKYDQAYFERTLRVTQTAHTTKDLVKLASDYYKLKG